MSTGTHTVTIGEHVVVMRNMSGRDLIATADADKDFAEALRRLGAAVVEHDFGGDILEQEWDTVLQPLLAHWRTGSEQEAVPSLNGEP